MRLHSVVVLFAGALALAACESVADAGPTGPFTISLPVSWPGSTVYVSSPDFRRGFTSAMLRVDTFTVQLTKSELNDSTVSGILPASVSGEVTTEVIVDGTRFPTRPLTVAGFADLRTIPGGTEAFVDEMYGWVKNGVASVIGGSGTTIRLLNLEQGTSSILTSTPAQYDLFAGASATYRPGIFLRLGLGDVIEEWDFNGAPRLETQDPAPSGLYSRVQTRLGPNVWIVGNDDRYWIVIRTGLGAPYVRSPEILGNYWSTHFSPREDLAARTGQRGSIGIPVYALPNGNIAFTVPMHSVSFTTFSQDGGLLASVGYGEPPSQNSWRLLIQDSNTGAVRLDTLLTEEALAIARDPILPRLYLALRVTTGQLAIQVYSSVTLKPIARLLAPPSSRAVGEGVIVISPLKGLYYYLPEAYAPGPIQSRIWHFTLPETN